MVAPSQPGDEDHVASTLPTKPAPVLIGLAPPQPQRRATVGFRWILAIPHSIVLGLLSIAGFGAVVAAWFAALFTGRVPTGLFKFIAKIEQYGLRVNAYIWMLTDQYPDFDLATTDYPISLLVPPAQRLNRAAVFFRMILATPVLILHALVYIGLTITGFFVWLIVLIRGRMPRSLFEAVAATVRFQIRTVAYLSLLTAAYPAGLFGDRADPVSAFAPAPVLEPLTSLAFPPPIPTQPQWMAASTATGPVSASAGPQATRLMLSKGGKRLVAMFVVFGVLYYAGTIAFSVAVGATHLEVINELSSDHGALISATTRFQKATAACGPSTDITCIERADAAVGAEFTIFTTRMGTIDFPASTQAKASQLEADSRALADLFQRLSLSGSLSAYNGLAGGLDSLTKKFDTDYHDLVNAL
jgi:hypothetical protein